jgi:hypothetical protein
MQRTTFVELCKWDCRATRNGGGDDGHAKTMANCSSNNVETVADPYGRGRQQGRSRVGAADFWKFARNN